MIPVQRLPLPPRTQGLLNRWSAKVPVNGGDTATARSLWRAAKAPKKHLQGVLGHMTRGARRCMHCDDNMGTDIDHFEPADIAPLRAFDWLNHLLACSHCNSNQKRDQHPCDALGNCLLVDPSVGDPADDLVLLLASGEYDPVTTKGVETIRVFGLNRVELVQGRQAAFARARSNLRDWHQQLKDGDHAEADRIAQALVDSPFAVVVHAMERLAPISRTSCIGGQGRSSSRGMDPGVSHLVSDPQQHLADWPSAS